MSGSYVRATSIVAGSCALVDDEVDEHLAEVIPFRPRRAIETLPTRTVLTARGRLLVMLAVGFVVALIVLVVSGRGDATFGEVRSVKVSNETSLAEVGAREMPGVPAREAAATLQGINDLPSWDVVPGQLVRVPVSG